MKTIKKYISRALLALLLSTQINADCSYELFSVSSTKDTKIIDFIDQLSDQCEFSVIVTDPHAQEFLNTPLNKTHLKNLTIEEVLNIILIENNLSYTLENNLLKISYLTTKVFAIDYILSQRKATGSTDITLSSSSSQSGSSANSTSNNSTSAQGNSSTTQSGIKIESNDEVKFWHQLDLELQQVLNRPEDKYEAAFPIINKNAGLITVTATVKQMRRLEKYLKKLQEKVQLQVLIDVQLLSVTMSEGKTTGVDWSQLYKLQNINLGLDRRDWQNVSTYEENLITEGTPYGNNLREVGQMFTIQAEGSLQEVIKFLQTQGDVNSISNPKVLTLNNQPALITAGTEYFYKIKSSTNQQGSGGGVAATTQNESIESVFAGVLLNITPEISDNDTITLKINPSLSETRDDISQSTSSDRIMPPDLSRRQLSSVVTVKNGNRIILGGLINSKNVQDSSKVPILGDIPGLSYLFRYEANSKQVEELVIVIETHIIKKSNNDLSLSDLGYTGISEDFIKNGKNSKSKDLENSSKSSEKEKNEI
ncbi:pilus (MSHA type) biogenesis protein MshL [Sulfurimonas lithotrophica]|uniref:Pilus (MSHA type) biogenesis protein MshL n=1 Tax=Sulfurimonas lithotrophica TaxID=2590022 RepID=A0A5P8NZZ4_9BACT|nr:pilus (MSHA type) biogenesis protein MshL [Sulfurimonas lithotrophica]QFR49019.1 pilus (MSHA type) biogenesis protein MshL [Sulfurimonas lithotrophica]